MIYLVSVEWAALGVLAGFIGGSLAGAGLSWLYAVATIFKQIERILKSITATEKKEEDDVPRKGKHTIFKEHVKAIK